jgi:hypothetical protein
MMLSLNELKLEIAEILDEAKKKKEKAVELKKMGASVEAYGIYDEAFDFSSPLGDFNRYKQQGGVNFGPYTSAGTKLDSNFSHPNTGPQMKENDEKALRSLVREVIQNGLVPDNSAWAPLMEKKEQLFESPWEAAGHLFEAWYDDFKKDKKSEKEPKKSKKDYGPVKKHGFEKKNKK